MQDKWNDFSQSVSEKSKDIRINYPNATDLAVLPMSVLLQVQRPAVFTDPNRKMLNDKLQEPSTTSFDKYTAEPVNNQLASEHRPLDTQSYKEIEKGIDLASSALDMHPAKFFGAYSKQQYRIGASFGKNGETGGQALHYALGFASKFLEGMADPISAEKQMKFGSSSND